VNKRKSEILGKPFSDGGNRIPEIQGIQINEKVKFLGMEIHSTSKATIESAWS